MGACFLYIHNALRLKIPGNCCSKFNQGIRVARTVFLSMFSIPTFFQRIAMPISSEPSCIVGVCLNSVPNDFRAEPSSEPRGYEEFTSWKFQHLILELILQAPPRTKLSVGSSITGPVRGESHVAG